MVAVTAIVLSTACGQEDPITFSFIPPDNDGIHTFTLTSQGPRDPTAATFTPPLDWVAVIVPPTSVGIGLVSVSLKQGDIECFASTHELGPLDKGNSYSVRSLGWGLGGCSSESGRFETTAVEVVLYDENGYDNNGNSYHAVARIVQPATFQFQAGVPLFP
jgi:hypothetical protein